MDEIRFEEPPYRRGRGAHGKHRDIAQQLRARPGEWAIIDTYDSSARAGGMAWQIKTATRLAAYLPGGAYEATARTVDGEHRVYARYVGEGRDE